MCVGRFLSCAFTLLTLTCLGLLCVALFTPGWQKFNQQINATQPANQEQLWMQRGLLFQRCTHNFTSAISCVNFWQTLKPWEQATFAMLFLAAGSCVMALVWTCIACGLCCCTSALMTLLPAFVALAFLLNLGGVGVYLHYSGKLDDVNKLLMIRNEKDVIKLQESLGYSLFCAIFSCAGLLIDIILSFFVIRAEKYDSF